MAIRRDDCNKHKQGITPAIEVAPTRPIRRDPAPLPWEEPVPQLPGEGNPSPANRTRLFGVPDGFSAQLDSQEDGCSKDPVVGWLVVIAGPGRGNTLTLGYGLNGIGRGPRARVQVDFGDLEISRDQHAVITYDPKGRRFYLQHGGGTNLTYLKQQPVLMPTELKGDEVIVIGQTRLRFVPLCGAAFDWQDGD